MILGSVWAEDINLAIVSTWMRFKPLSRWDHQHNKEIKRRGSGSEPWAKVTLKGQKKQDTAKRRQRRRGSNVERNPAACGILGAKWRKSFQEKRNYQLCKMLLIEQVRWGLRTEFSSLRVFVDLDESNFGGRQSVKSLRSECKRGTKRGIGDWKFRKLF